MSEAKKNYYRVLNMRKLQGDYTPSYSDLYIEELESRLPKEDLLSCPFCGNADQDVLGTTERGNYFVVMCFECDTEGPLQDTEDAAREAWNRRV